ncbi:cytochrome c peroxidase [Microbulbifer sp. ALW1]|uniref:cytochrome c peroxidase n=1 Tax=Microbulbifer sp. (strain ALW1) TaxID=1516059 RepID=UPI0013576011|nr:cytochrome c peroxidase [Microbulbifer sp. ALW1]
MKYKTLCGLWWLILGVTYPFAQSQAAYLLPEKQVCTIPDGTNRCGIDIRFGNESGNTQQCLFIKASQKLVACSTGQKRVTYDFVYKTPVTLELRSGSSSYGASVLQESITLLGLESRALPGNAVLESVKLDYLKKSDKAFVTSTWDGRVNFAAQVIGGGKYAWVAYALRADNIKAGADGSVNFGDSELFDNGYVLDSENCGDKINKGYKQFISGWPESSSNDECVNPQKLDTADGKIHLAVFPHPSIKNNPFRSDFNGNSTTDPSSKYQTYRLYGILASTRIGADTSDKVLANKRDTGDLHHILGKFQAIVVVENSGTATAQVVNTRILAPAKALRTSSGGFLYGYEPSVTLDGGLILFSGNDRPGEVGGNGGQVMYTYNNNAFNYTGWAPQKNLSAMYKSVGAGRSGGPISVGGVPFDQMYPIAKAPIKDYRGSVLDESVPIPAAYPWVSFDGADAIFSSIPGYYAAARHGTHIVGERTHHILTHIDGDMNLTRGNPTDRFYFKDVNPAAYSELKDHYENKLLLPNFGNASPGLNGSEQVLFSPVGLFNSSWQPLSDTLNKVLPIHPALDQYAFYTGSGKRYVEIPLLEDFEDLLLYYPLNEPVLYDASIIRSGADDEEAKINKVRYVPDEVADYSGFLQRGYLNGDAKFPFEYYDVKNRWANDKELKDRQEGKFGNSVFFKPSGYIQSTLKSQAYDQLYDKQEFTQAFWVKKASSNGPVVDIEDTLLVWLNGSAMDFRVYTSKYPLSAGGKRVVVNGVTTANAWNHYAIVFKNGALTVYVDGEKVHSESGLGTMASGSSHPNGRTMKFGPSGSLSTSVLQMDEIYLYSAALDAQEIARLALKRRNSPDSGIATPTVFSEEAHFAPMTSGDDAKIKALGKTLFQSTKLSIDQTVSCQSCHVPQFAFADDSPGSFGVSGQTSRNSPSLMNLLFQNAFFWDGRAHSLEEQVMHPILNASEMGFHNDPSALITRLTNDSNLKAQFTGAFNGRNPNYTDLALALSRYVRGLMVEHDGADVASLTDSERRGKEIFFHHGNCVACHTYPTFTDGRLHNIDTGTLDDSGAYLSTARESDQGSFKTPSLLNVADSAPYFHDGRFATLEEVVEHYNQGGSKPFAQSPHLRPLGLNSSKKADLVNYLKSLHGNIVEH